MVNYLNIKVKIGDKEFAVLELPEFIKEYELGSQSLLRKKSGENMLIKLAKCELSLKIALILRSMIESLATNNLVILVASSALETPIEPLFFSLSRERRFVTSDFTDLVIKYPLPSRQLWEEDLCYFERRSFAEISAKALGYSKWEDAPSSLYSRYVADGISLSKKDLIEKRLIAGTIKL